MSETSSESIHSDIVRDGDQFREELFRCCRQVGDLVRHTYGPYGRASLVVDHADEKHVTTDGATVLDHAVIDHPVGKMFVDTFGREEVRDGATFGTLLAVELLTEAERLIERGLSRQTVCRGYETALEQARDHVNEVAHSIGSDPEVLALLAKTAIADGEFDETDQHLVNVVVDAVRTLDNGGDVTNVYFEEDIRLSVDSSRVVAGTIVRNDPLHNPGPVSKPTVLLIKGGLTDQPDGDSFDDVNISGPAAYESVHGELSTPDERVDDIVSSGADVVICNGPIPSSVARPLAEHNLLLVDEVTEAQFERVHAAVGGDTIEGTKLSDATLGRAGQATVTDHGAGTRQAIVFGDCSETETVTVVVNGGTGSVTDYARQRIEAGVQSLTAWQSSGLVVPGAGATEMVVATRLRDGLEDGREQLAVQGFASAIERLPLILASNCGLDPTTVRPKLRTAHRDDPGTGVDVDCGGTCDALDRGVLEPYGIKSDRLTAAVALASGILRIDGAVLSS